MQRRFAGIFATSVLVLCASISQVYADAPAVSDFGQSRVAETFSSDSVRRAVFVTLYSDGRQQVEWRIIRNDAVNTFAGEHPAWHLDHGLMWFLQVPVFVREVSSDSSGVV